MTRFSGKRVVRGGIGHSQMREVELGTATTSFEQAAETLRLKTALKRAVAKTQVPEYLIEAIRREIRK